jgi:hypothetical protein
MKTTIYIFSVIHPLGNFIYIVTVDNLFTATDIIKKMAGEKAQIMEISHDEAQFLVNSEGYKMFFAW